MINQKNRFSIQHTIRNFLFLVVLTILLLCLTACFNPWQVEEKGIIIINLGAAAESGRSSLPWPPQEHGFIDDLKHIITFSSGSRTLPPIEKTGIGTVTQQVSPGRWEITVVAYLDGESSSIPEGKAILYAGGSIIVDVEAGQNKSIEIIMNPGCQDCEEYPCVCDFNGIAKSITITGLNDYNNEDVMVFLVKDDVIFGFNEDMLEAIGGGTITGGIANISLMEFSHDGEGKPWTGSGSWFVGIMLDLDDTAILRISTARVNFSGAAASISFVQFKRMVFEYNFGWMIEEYYEILDFDWLAITTLDQLVIAAGKGDFLGYADWSSYMGFEFYTTKELDIPFTGSFDVNRDMTFFSDFPLGWSRDDQGPNQDGVHIGTFMVNLILFDIGDYPSIVDIHLSGGSDDGEGNWIPWFGSTRVDTIGAGNNASIRTEMPFYLGRGGVSDSDIFPVDANFSLTVRPAGSRDRFSVPLGNVHINDLNQTDIILLGSVQCIRLNGTVSFSYTGSPSVNTIIISARLPDGIWLSGGSNINWPKQNTWSLLIPASPNLRRIELDVNGAYSDEYEWVSLFTRTFTREVSNQDQTGILLDLGAVSRDQ